MRLFLKPFRMPGIAEATELFGDIGGVERIKPATQAANAGLAPLVDEPVGTTAILRKCGPASIRLALVLGHVAQELGKWHGLAHTSSSSSGSANSSTTRSISASTPLASSVSAHQASLPGAHVSSRRVTRALAVSQRRSNTARPRLTALGPPPPRPDNPS